MEPASTCSGTEVRTTYSVRIWPTTTVATAQDRPRRVSWPCVHASPPPRPPPTHTHHPLPSPPPSPPYPQPTPPLLPPPPLRLSLRHQLKHKRESLHPTSAPRARTGSRRNRRDERLPHHPLLLLALLCRSRAAQQVQVAPSPACCCCSAPRRCSSSHSNDWWTNRFSLCAHARPTVIPPSHSPQSFRPVIFL